MADVWESDWPAADNTPWESDWPSTGNPGGVSDGIPTGSPTNWGSIAEGVAGTLLGGIGNKGNKAAGNIAANAGKVGDRLVAGMDSFMADILSQTAGQYGKANAISDVQGAIAGIFDQYQKTALPEIYQGEMNSGGYNGTTGQLLANDAFAQTNNRAAALMLDTIQKYRTSQQNDYNTLAGLARSAPGVPSQAGGGGSAGSSILGGIISKGVGALAGAIFSDSRLKENIRKIGVANGFTQYEFSYREDPAKQLYVGVMADEVIQTRPDAIEFDAEGFMKVNYTLLNVPFYKVPTASLE